MSAETSLQQGRHPIRVLQVVPGVARGGVETHVATLLSRFQGSAVECQLATLYEGWLADEARKIGVQVHVLRRRFRGDVRVVHRLMRIIKRERIDIVHSHMVGGNFYGRLAGRCAGVRGIVSTLHYSNSGGVAPPQWRKPNWIHEMLFRTDVAMSPLSDRLITPMDGIRPQFAKAGMDGDRMVTIRNSVDVELFQVREADRARVRQELGLAAGTIAIGAMGRLDPVKNHDLFLRAARRVADAQAEAVFLVIGDGPLRSALEGKAAALGLGGRVIFTGLRSDAAHVLAALDIVVLSSNSEMSPYVVWEAMALGKPVVATAVGAVPELVESGRDGILCPCNDEVALATAITDLARDRGRREEIGRNARQRAVSEFALEGAIARLRKLYEDVLGRSR